MCHLISDKDKKILRRRLSPHKKYLKIPKEGREILQVLNLLSVSDESELLNKLTKISDNVDLAITKSVLRREIRKILINYLLWA
eukprot:UN33694